MLMTKKCKKCQKNPPIPYDEIGLGMYCQNCLDEEEADWVKEA